MYGLQLQQPMAVRTPNHGPSTYCTPQILQETAKRAVGNAYVLTDILVSAVMQFDHMLTFRKDVLYVVRSAQVQRIWCIVRRLFAGLQVICTHMFSSLTVREALLRRYTVSFPHQELGLVNS